MRGKPPVRLAVIAAAVVTSASLITTPAVGTAEPPGIVSEQPSPHTPHALDGSVDAFAQVGHVMFAGGTFTQVTSPDGSKRYYRPYLVAFDVRTGEVLPDTPSPDRRVLALEASPDGSALYIGGRFSHVDGVPADRLAKWDVASGALDREFAPSLGGRRVSDLGFAHDKLIVGGTFPGRLTVLDPLSGRDSGDIDLAITGELGDGYWPDVYRFAISPDENRMVIIGNFTHIDGVPRRQAALLDLEPDGAALSSWYSPRWTRACASGTAWYTRDVDWMPDGRHFVIVTTGHNFPGTDKLCSSASMWADDADPAAQPVWVNHTGGNSLFSVAATPAAVYVSGHPRWLDNPDGEKSAGPGAVRRLGIGAIDPSTGKALPWNPTRTRGYGAQVLYPTGDGLWVGSDTSTFAHQHRGRIAFVPAE